MNLVPSQSLFDLDHLLDFWGRSQAPEPANGNTFMPRVDVTDKGDHYEITADLPGVAREDINVTLNEGVLSIEAISRSENKEEKDGKIIRQERRFGKFARSFMLGSECQDGQVSAKFENGVLSLKAPKAVPQKEKPRQIKVH